MKQQENMILNQLNQYRSLYLQANNKIEGLKHAVAQHENKLKTRQELIESMDSRILELEKGNEAVAAERDDYKAKYEQERDSHVKAKEELKALREENAKLQDAKEAKELSEQANVDLHSVVQVLQHRLFKTNSDATAYMKGEVEFDERRMNDMEFKDVVEEADKLVKELNEEKLF